MIPNGTNDQGTISDSLSSVDSLCMNYASFSYKKSVVAAQGSMIDPFTDSS